MNIAVFLCPASQVGRLARQRYDIVLTPEKTIHPSIKSSPKLERIVATTAESSLEASIFRPKVNSICKPLGLVFGEDSVPIVRRGLYLSALKNELRLLIDASIWLDCVALSSETNLDVYYTYLTFPELFAHDRFIITWCPCPRIRQGKLAHIFRFLGKLRPSSSHKSYL